jgi:pyridoxal phosphate phosphatase PHOSPHO2
MFHRICKVAAFDFDNTIINFNSDTYINKLIDSGKKIKFPNEIEILRDTHGWTQRMNAVFKYMLDVHKINKEIMINCIKEIQIEKPMLDLLGELNKNQFEIIIISDANSIFIETILKENGISEYISKIYTNPAHFDDNDCLRVTPFNEIFNKNGEIFTCETGICERNMCKGTILKSHIEKYSNESSPTLVYVGDGTNDLCPGFVLKEDDFYFVKNNFSLDKLLKKDQGLRTKILGKLFYWNDADSILKNLNFK